MVVMVLSDDNPFAFTYLWKPSVIFGAWLKYVVMILDLQ